MPELFRTRLLSLRGFDGAGMLRAARVADGTVLKDALGELLADRALAYAHVYVAGPGCYAARADRVL